MNLDRIPRISLTTLPTPLEEAPRLGGQIGLRRLLVKRDDTTTLAMGGNKVRKLEYLMADALAQQCDVVMTDGGPQSNHARLTAAAARRVGIERCILFLGGREFERFDGNLLLDVVFGAEIRFLKDANVRDMEDAMAREADRLRQAGSRPYVIPVGGSSPLGALGYVNAMKELAGQLPAEDRAPLVVVAVGSTATVAGCALGLRIFLPDAELLGISVSRKSKPLQKTAAALASEAAKLLDVDEHFEPVDIVVRDEFYGDFYGVPTPAGNEAILLAARTEGLVLDPVYTGKAMSGLIGLAETAQIDRARTTVFIHTGGSPSLMAFEEQFRVLADFRVEPFPPSGPED